MLESWYLLGHTLMRHDDAPGRVTAFEHVYAAGTGTIRSVQVALAQARFVADRGTVTDANRALIDRILAADPQQAVVLEMSRARFISQSRLRDCGATSADRASPAVRPARAPTR